jgi:hypothetical protein
MARECGRRAYIARVKIFACVKICVGGGRRKRARDAGLSSLSSLSSLWLGGGGAACELYLRMNHGLRLFTFNEAFAWVAAPYYCTALALCEQF